MREWTRNECSFRVLNITPKSSVLMIRKARGSLKFFAWLPDTTGNQPWADRLEGENVTALSTTASKDTTAALRAAADKKTVRASALGLGGLVGTLSSHDYSLMSGESLQTGEKPYFCGRRIQSCEETQRFCAFLFVSNGP